MNRSDGLAVMATLHPVDYALHHCARLAPLRVGGSCTMARPPGASAQLVEIHGPEFEDVFWEGAPQ